MTRPLQSILIIHPEGNITNNPGLSSLILLLIDYYQIFYVRDIDHQDEIDKRLNIFLLKDLTDNNKFENYLECINENIQDIIFSLIIGIDQGIKFANYIANDRNLPLALISYEIFFINEWDDTLKKQEIDACKNISFALCQDSMRSYLLSKENCIPIEKIINIPISESYNGPYKKSSYLHEELKIPSEKKILLYVGSIGNWTMTRELINCTKTWPDDWVLVLHPRYGIDSTVTPILGLIDNNPKIYLSKKAVKFTYDLENIICSADLGIILYDIDISSLYTGKNILFMGLSSGKFSMFMKYNIPIILNNITNTSDIVYMNHLGYLISDFNEISSILLNYKINSFSNNCVNFFLNFLDFNLYKNVILSIIESTILKKNIHNIIKINNAKIELKNISSVRIKLIYDNLRNHLNITKKDTNNYQNKSLKTNLKRIIKLLIPVQIREYIKNNIFKNNKNT